MGQTFSGAGFLTRAFLSHARPITMGWYNTKVSCWMYMYLLARN